MAHCPHLYLLVFSGVWSPPLTLPEDFPTFCYSQKLYAEPVERQYWWLGLFPPRLVFYPLLKLQCCTCLGLCLSAPALIEQEGDTPGPSSWVFASCWTFLQVVGVFSWETQTDYLYVHLVLITILIALEYSAEMKNWTMIINMFI